MTPNDASVDNRGVDAESAASTPPPTTAALDKPPTKISCLACRAAKRKCLTPDEFTTCKRCASQHLHCEYKKHRRGRRKKNADAALQDAAHLSPIPPLSKAQPISPGEGPGTTATGIVAPLPVGKTEPKRIDIQFSHVVPIEGDSSPYLPNAGQTTLEPPSGSSPREPTPMEQLLRTDCPDPVRAGFLTEADEYELFEFYFRHLNVTVAILDPVLHTAAYCRAKSPLLYTAVLTVTSKVIRPKVYSSCLLLANKLIGQAVELGLCSVEIIQSLSLLTHWKKADDATSWRRVGYAIRMAQELKLNVKAPRPLPQNERQARDILNRERAWLNLIVQDYHLAIHHTLPRMISEEGINDPAEWLADHRHLPCPGETSLGPMITFSRMCRLYADMLAAMSGDPANLRLIDWLELEWKRWRSRWLDNNQEYEFKQQQISAIKLCDAYFRFHICEYRLLYTARYKAQGQALDTSEPTPLAFAFSECVDASLGVIYVFQDDFVRHGFLPYSFHLSWVALAVNSVWLVKNIVAMNPADRTRVIRILSDVQTSTEEASCSSDDMAAYTHRLLKHLLSGISPEWRLTSFVTPTSHVRQEPYGAGTSTTPSSGASMESSSASAWPCASTHEIIQEHLWSSYAYPHAQPQAAAGNVDGHGYPMQVHNERYNAQTMQQQHHHAEDMLFPADDDSFWRLFFAMTNGSGPSA